MSPYQEIFQPVNPSFPFDPLVLANELITVAFRGLERYGGLPRVFHSQEVMLYCLHQGYDVETLAAALLHDTVEDTDVTLKNIEYLFGTEIASLVQACSHDKTIYQANPQEGNRDLLARARAKGVDALRIKCADYICNLRTFEQLPKKYHLEVLYAARQLYLVAFQDLPESDHKILLPTLLERIEAAERYSGIVLPE